MEIQNSKFKIVKFLRPLFLKFRYCHSRLSALSRIRRGESGILLRSPERCRTSRHDRYEVLANQKGIALAIVLILSVIALAIMAALIYMLTSSTQISGMQKRYKTAYEAGVGGADVIYQLLSARGNPNIPGITDGTGAAAFFSTAFTSPCMTAKLNSSSSTTNWTACASNAADYELTTSINIDPSNPKTYDTKFQLGTTPLQYTVYSKIVNTVEGNSSGGEGLIKSGVVASNSGEVAVVSVPYLYTIEISAENTSNNAERAKISLLYQY